jgi:hypothetical protein
MGLNRVMCPGLFLTLQPSTADWIIDFPERLLRPSHGTAPEVVGDRQVGSLIFVVTYQWC